MPRPPQSPPLDPLAAKVVDLYARGLFPMGDVDRPEDPPDWYAVTGANRGVLPLNRPTEPPAPGLPPGSGFRVPRRLVTRMRTCPFRLTRDAAFLRVVRACGDPRREGGWITPAIEQLALFLHEQGVAHSYEVWLPPEDRRRPLGLDPRRGRPPDLGQGPRAVPEAATLVGGLYGVDLGRVFVAESMFSRPDLGGTDASKAALVAAALDLRAREAVAMDAQMTSPLLQRFGFVTINAEAFATLVGPRAHGPVYKHDI